MVELETVIVDLAQTIALIAALWFPYKEMKVRRQERTMENYLGANAAYAEAARVMIENPELHGLYDGDPEYRKFSDKRKPRALYCDWAISICETVWSEDRDGLIPKGEWKSWLGWLVWFHDVSEDFRTAWKWVGGPQATEWGPEYDPKFIAAVNAGIEAHARRENQATKA